MQPKLNRAELDQIAGHYALDAAGADTLLEVAEARPGSQASRHFLASMARIGGILSLAAGVVFFVAANWSEIAIFGRFALLELMLVACGVVAMVRPPPGGVGRAALFLAFIVSGALLALFGQTYQTGADIYELFLGWALLGLPLVVLGNWSVSSAAWLIVLNVALLLFCGGHPTGGLLWAVFGGRGFQPATIVLGIAWLNLLLWFVFEHLKLVAVPGWVRRLAVSSAFAFGTWAGVSAIFDRDVSAYVGLGVLAAMVVVGGYAMQQRRDIYPLAVVLGSFIIMSLVWLAKVVQFRDEGMFLLLALWLIGTSTAAGRFLAETSRRWREQDAS